MRFSTWITTFLEEKGIDREDFVIAEGEMGENQIPVGILVDMMKATSSDEQKAIKTTLVKIDFFAPGRKPVMDYLSHIAQAVAI